MIIRSVTLGLAVVGAFGIASAHALPHSAVFSNAEVTATVASDRVAQHKPPAPTPPHNGKGKDHDKGKGKDHDKGKGQDCRPDPHRPGHQICKPHKSAH